jgi:hypothetical protein
LDFLTQFQNIYANVTNIVVRLSLSNVSDALDDSLMLSSHFDAAYGSAAASDDGVNVAIMMELLRLYATVPPQYGSLVFTFNGAEETIMQAAHGFITQHEWTKNIRAFINLEAAGAGGRALLFQTGSDELVRAYAEGAKYPYANIIAQEMFKTGVIPADTDFRVYRDFGEVAGMDFAYIYNGYVYHTALDDISRIQQGSIQHFGDNLVGVIQRLTSVPGRLRQVATSPRTSNTLFVDVLGIWMISTSKATAFTICGVVLLLSVVYLIQSPLHLSERTAGIKVVLQCMGSGVGASLVAGVVLTLFAPLTWYSSPLLVAVSFVPPALTGMLHRLITFLQSTKLKDSEVLWRIEEGLFEAMLCIWALGLVFLLGADLISSYVAAVWVIFPLVGQVLCHVLQSWNVLSSWSYSVISLLAALVPVLHSAMVLSIAFIFFVPLMGRCGPLVPPDLVMAVVVSLSLLVILSFTSRFFCFVPINKLVLLRNACFSISVVVVLLASTRNPFTDSTPKRLFVQHIHRQVLHDNGTLEHLDAGVWVTGLDYRGLGAIQPFLATTQWNQTTPVAPPKFLMDTNEVYGDLPFGLPVREFVPERLSWLLPSNPPVFQEGEPRATLKVISSHYDTTTDKRTIHLHFTGHSHLNIYIDSSTRLTSWYVKATYLTPLVPSEEIVLTALTTGPWAMVLMCLLLLRMVLTSCNSPRVFHRLPSTFGSKLSRISLLTLQLWGTISRNPLLNSQNLFRCCHRGLMLSVLYPLGILKPFETYRTTLKSSC